MSEAQKTGHPPAIERNGYVSCIRLRRPEQHNRLQVEDLERLHKLLGVVRADESARVLVLAAEGSSFCAGFDLSTAAAEAPGPGSLPELLLQQLCDEVEAFPLPTVCAINGGVYGGGTDLALACDFRVGVSNARLRMPAVQLGISFYPGGISRYVTRLGLAASKRLFLLGEELDAGQLEAAGFLDEVVAGREDLDATVRRYVERLGAMPASALANTKKGLNAAAHGRLDFASAQQSFLNSLFSEEFAATRAAWSHRQTPSKVQQ